MWGWVHTQGFRIGNTNRFYGSNKISWYVSLGKISFWSRIYKSQRDDLILVVELTCSLIGWIKEEKIIGVGWIWQIGT